MDLLKLIELHKNDFSKTELKVYDYIINNLENIETYTISKIATQSDTSTSAVLRFCQVLGFKGYKDFRFATINYLHEHIEEKDSNDLFDQLTNEYVKTIAQFTKIDRKTVEKLINDLKESKMAYILGIYYSSLPCRQLKAGLMDLGIMAYSGHDFMEISHLSNTIKEDATVVFFSVSGAQANFNRALTSLENNLPEKSYLITMNPNSQLINLFKNTIVLPGNSLTKQSIVDCESIFMIFVEMLLNLLHNSF